MAKGTVRIYLQFSGKIPNYDVGHYELQVEGQITVHGKSYVNPILSYGVKGNSLDIFNNGAQGLTDNWMLCTAAFDFDSGKLALLENWLNSCCGTTYTVGEVPGGISDRYYVEYGDFHKYETERYNCFAAVAVWCELLGNPALKGIYNQYSYPNGVYNPNGYTNYGAWAMFGNYYRSWVFEMLQNS